MEKSPVKLLRNKSTYLKRPYPEIAIKNKFINTQQEQSSKDPKKPAVIQPGGGLV